MNCGEIFFKILDLLVSISGLVVAGIVAYFAYKAFQSQSQQLLTMMEQRNDDKAAFDMAKAEFEASQPTLVQIRMKNCPRFQIGALPNNNDVYLSHVILSSHLTHGEPISIEVSHTISNRDIRAIQNKGRLEPFLSNVCLILSNLNSDADLEQWQCEVLGERTVSSVLFGKIQKVRLKIGSGTYEESASADSWGLLLMVEKDQEISLEKFRIRIHFETKTGWQDFHDYDIWPACASCKRINPPVMPSYKDPYLEE